MEILHVKILTCLFVFIFPIVTSQKCNGRANCIALDQCTVLYERLKKGNNAELTDLLRELHCGFETSVKPKICCPPEYLNQANANSAQFLESRNNIDPLSLLPSNNDCGIQSADRIVGGEQTDIDEFPWTALVRYDKPSGWGFYCGGVLISSRYVLSAAHCVKGSDLPPSWRLSQVRLGEWNTSSEVDCFHDDCSGPVQDIPVEQTVAHELYNPEDADQQNDIALLKLSRHAQINDYVTPICLPVSSNLRRNDFEGNNLVVAGWGKTETRTESEVKLKVQVPYVGRTECADVYQRVNRRITEKQLCAGGVSGRDSCRGDSGGALMSDAPSGTNWVVYGVVSYGPSPCGTEGWPGVYTRVGAYMNWILLNIRS